MTLHFEDGPVELVRCAQCGAWVEPPTVCGACTMCAEEILAQEAHVHQLARDQADSGQGWGLAGEVRFWPAADRFWPTSAFDDHRD